MGKNTKPMLTVLVEGDKLQQFRDYALSKEVSMGWLVNRLLDRLLSGELEVMTDSPSSGTNREAIEHTPTGLTREYIEEMIKASIEQSLDKPYTSNPSSSGFSPESIDEMVRVSIEKQMAMDNHLDRLVKESLGSLEIQKIVNESIEVAIDIAIEPIAKKVAKIEQTLIDSPAPNREAEAEPDRIATWSEFFRIDLSENS